MRIPNPELFPSLVARPAAVSAVKEYETQTLLLMARRIAVGSPLFLGVIALLTAFEWRLWPERRGWSLLAYGAYVLVSAIQWLIVRREPMRSISVTIGVINALALTLCLYFGVVGSRTEPLVLSLVLLLVGVATLYPWGGRGQLAVSWMPLVGYPVALWLGATPSMPFVYDGLALATAGFVGVLGAAILDRQRFETYQQVLQRQEQEEISTALLQVGQALNDVLSDPQRLVGALVEQSRLALGADWAFLFQLEPQSGGFHAGAVSGAAREVREEVMTLNFSPQIAPLLFDRLQRDGVAKIRAQDDDWKLLSGLLRHWNAAAVLLQAIRRGDEITGVLGCCFTSGHQELTAQERRIIGGIGNQAGVALDNAHLMNEALRADQVKSEFVATMSHELRTPLSVIIGYTDLLRDDSCELPRSEQRSMLERIHEQSGELLELIEGLLDLNRLELRRTTLKLSTFTMSDLLDSLRAQLPASWLKDAVSLEWRVVDDVTLVSDRSKVETIVRNLVHNALKYTDRGSVTVTARKATSGQRLELSVADTGPGIARADRPLIFDMFRQGQVPRGGGVGLGLYIVKRLCQLLDSDVRLLDDDAVGATFVVSLPIEAHRAPEAN